ncbi:MAG: sugar phosphate isomerase/epimerase [Firmicutes bacterium]|nr:sugar phosphate isomerase/epimerase [Bacillota bacterium]
MIKIGRNVRYFNPYKEEVEFSKKHSFDFMQVWYDKDGIGLHKDNEPKQEIIKKYNFPTIIHAVLDINEIEEHIPKLIKMLKYLEHKDLIIHPICRSEQITNQTIYKLSEKVKKAFELLSDENIKLYLENNSRLNPIFNKVEELEIMFKENPEVEFLLDVAHIDDYSHLKNMIEVKMPKILHVADRHLDIIHEHLPLGHGNIDYSYIFREVLNQFEGKIILEIVQNDDVIIKSRDMIERIIMNK